MCWNKNNCHLDGKDQQWTITFPELGTEPWKITICWRKRIRVESSEIGRELTESLEIDKMLKRKEQGSLESSPWLLSHMINPERQCGSSGSSAPIWQYWFQEKHMGCTNYKNSTAFYSKRDSVYQTSWSWGGSPVQILSYLGFNQVLFWAVLTVWNWATE